MTTTTHLGITLVEQSQAQKEVTVNQALTRIDAVLNSGVITQSLSAPPGSPVVGDVYIVGASATGEWAGHDDELAYFDQIWRFIMPNEGMTLWVNDEDLIYTYDGSAWIASALGESNTASNMGGGEGIFASKSGVDLRFKSLVAGSNITLTSSGTEITVAATGGGGGGGGYTTIQEEGSALTQRDTLNFVGAGIAASDNSGDSRTDVALDATLNALAGVTTAADKMIYATGSDTFTTTDFTSTARSLLDDTSTSAMRTTLGLAIGSDVQAQNARLQDIASNLNTGSGTVEKTSANTFGTYAVTSAAKTLLDDTTTGAMLITLGAQPMDTTLTALTSYNTNGLLTQTAADTFTGRTLTGGGGITVTNGNGVSGHPTLGISAKRTLSIPAAAMRPSVSSGCANLALVAGSSNQPDLSTLDFDSSTVEFAQFWVPMPKGWNEGTVSAQFLWSHASTTTNFGVRWGIQAVAVSDDDTLAATYGAAQEVTDTGGTTNDLYISGETSAVTIAGSPVEGDMVCFRLYRDPANAADTLAVDARLHAVKLYFTINTLDDA